MATITITLRETGQSITATLKAAAPPPKIKDFVVDEEGYITKVSETNGDNMYRLHRKTNWDKGIKDKYITLNNGKVIEELAERRNVYKSSSGFWGEKEGVFVKMASKDDAYKLFKFVCDASLQAEWALYVYEKRKSKVSIYTLATSNFSESPGVVPVPDGFSFFDLKINYHSHPGSTPRDDKASAQVDDAIGDLPQANGYYDKFLSAKERNLPAFIIYRPHREKIPYKFQYTNLVNLIEGTKKVVNTYKDLYDGIIFYRFKH